MITNKRKGQTHGEVQEVGAPLPSAHKCIKRRSISDAHCKNFGAFEPVAFLACWKDMPCNEGERHVKKLPTFDMVRNFVVANPTFMNDNGIVPPP